MRVFQIKLYECYTERIVSFRHIVATDLRAMVLVSRKWQNLLSVIILSVATFPVAQAQYLYSNSEMFLQPQFALHRKHRLPRL